jgi:hypothetical protein
MDKIATRAGRCDCLERETAIDTTAIRNYLPVHGNLRQSALKFGCRDVECARKMA